MFFSSRCSYFHQHWCNRNICPDWTSVDQHIYQHQDKWNILQKKRTNVHRLIKEWKLISTSFASRTIVTCWTITVGMTCCCNDIFLASTTIQTWTGRAIAQCSYRKSISWVFSINQGEKFLPFNSQYSPKVPYRQRQTPSYGPLVFRIPHTPLFLQTILSHKFTSGKRKDMDSTW